ncbi:RNase A-like domain-containing protein [Streptomyces roseicoloratus]|uniref:RNase A-like domain-containing protein n=1 Tax=Streptomyces roseicoloratus TaxID=2508722 RepID=UPI0035A6A128
MTADETPDTTPGSAAETAPGPVSAPAPDLTKRAAPSGPSGPSGPSALPVPARADRAATFPDRATAQWATQQVISLNEQVIHRWLAQSTRQRLVIEAAWPSRPDPVGTLLTTGMALVGQEPIEVRAARVVLCRHTSEEPGAYPFTVHSSLPVVL